MSDTWEEILNLVQRGEIMVSEHGYEGIAADDIRVRDIVSGVAHAYSGAIWDHLVWLEHKLEHKIEYPSYAFSR